jgi:hypothetical protein
MSKRNRIGIAVRRSKGEPGLQQKILFHYLISTATRDSFIWNLRLSVITLVPSYTLPRRHQLAWGCHAITSKLRTTRKVKSICYTKRITICVHFRIMVNVTLYYLHAVHSMSLITVREKRIQNCSHWYLKGRFWRYGRERIVNKKNSMVWVRERTIPVERSPLVGEVIAKYCG